MVQQELSHTELINDNTSEKLFPSNFQGQTNPQIEADRLYAMKIAQTGKTGALNNQVAVGEEALYKSFNDEGFCEIFTSQKYVSVTDHDLVQTSDDLQGKPLRFTNVDYSNAESGFQADKKEEVKMEQKPKKLEDDFLIIVDGEEKEALMSYYGPLNMNP